MTDRPTHCEECAKAIEQNWIGRPRHYCSQACRQSAYLARMKQRMRASNRGTTVPS